MTVSTMVLETVFNGECHYAECRYTECRYAECRGAISCQGQTP
jgi:hypothetical protein